MAESFARELAGDFITPLSAGVSPLGYVPSEVHAVMEEIGHSCDGQWSKSLPEAQGGEAVDLIVDLADVLAAGLTAVPIRRMKVTDPFGGDLEDFRATRDAVKERLEPLFDALRDAVPPDLPDLDD